MKIQSFSNLSEIESLTIKDSANTLILMFGDSSYSSQDEPFLKINRMYPAAKKIGCSTAGEIVGDAIRSKSLSGIAVDFEKTHLRMASSAIENSKDSFAAGQHIAEQLFRPDLNLIFVLSDGLNVNGSQLVKGLNSILPENIVVSGGLAADDDRFKETWVLNNGFPVNRIVSAVGFYGENLKVGHGSKGGWDIFGPERKVTKSKENQLFELDGKPALQLYKEYLGDRAAELPASALLFPLALRSSEKDRKQIVRTILSVDEETQSLTFAGDIPENSLAQLMRANFDRLIEGASDASIMTKSNVDSDELVLSIAVSCVGRRLILGERADEELEAVMEYLPKNTQQIGFYSYGEISPYQSGHCDLHNQTMTLTTISEG